MKKKIFIFSSIFALLLMIAFIPTNKVSASSIGTNITPGEYVDNLYFNTELTVEEVDSICDNLDFTFVDYAYSYILFENDEFSICINDMTEVDPSLLDLPSDFVGGISIVINSSTFDSIVVFCDCDIISSIFGVSTGRWFINSFVINSICSFDSMSGILINPNDTSNLVSTTPYTLGGSDNSIGSYDEGYEQAIKDLENKYADYELKSILGPFYNGVYFGYINHDLTSSSVPTEFLKEYKNNKTLLEGRYFDLDYIIRSIHSDLGDGVLSSTSTTSFTIYFIPGDPIKITSLDFSIKGVDGLSLIDENGSTYYYTNNMHVGSFDNFTFKDVSSDVFIGAIIFHIDNYSEFLKNDGFFRYNGINTIYYEGYDKGYINGSSLADSKYEEGYDKGFSDGENVGFNKGVLEKNPVTLRTLFWTIAGLPFETFKHIVNFDFLGYNVASVFTVSHLIWSSFSKYICICL